MAEMIACELCGNPMPEGEEALRHHGYSGPCPKTAEPVRSLSDLVKASPTPTTPTGIILHQLIGWKKITPHVACVDLVRMSESIAAALERAPTEQETPAPGRIDG